MQIAVVYSSHTGNTATLAAAVKEILPEEACAFYGTSAELSDLSVVQQADMVLVGFWTDKGTCDESTAQFLQQLENKQVFLFGTAGFGGSAEFFQQILNRVTQNLAPSNVVLGTWMCQGKMPMAVRKRYESMQEQQPEQMKMMIDNFDRALSHPDEADLAALQQAVQNVVEG